MENSQAASQRYPLAIDSEGNAVEVPPTAVAWRVRKLATKAGRPKLIFDTETGRPLEVALTATANDLAEHLTESGRYRLEAVDAQGRTLPGCVATTELAIEEETESEAPATLRSLSLMEHMFAQMINSNAKLVDSNTRVMEALAQRFALVSISEPEREQVVATPPVAAPASKTGNTADNLAAFSQIAAQVMSMVQAMRSAQPAATSGQASDQVSS